jgi:ubiquinone/menaquinone biosynthesis C-methylase UbiE
VTQDRVTRRASPNQASLTRWVSNYFSNIADYWDDVYSRHDVKAQVYRNRQATAVAWAESVASKGDVVADVGTGAGHLATALALQGFRVTAIDTSEAMLEQVTSNAARASVTHLVTPVVSDAQQLKVPSGTCDVVIAIGLLPWVEEPEIAVAELARIVRSGGHVIATMDNARSLSRWLDPAWHSSVRRLKADMRRRFPRLRPNRRPVPFPAATTTRDFDQLLRNGGLIPTAYRGVGFGPFTLLSRTAIPNRLGLCIDRTLQYLADRNLPGLRHSAVFHVVLARKPDLPEE